ncbi:ThiS protein [Advenella kashmirensis WT001]|uniref:ThiS protein n=1 Tax=Advenella kashmirensis (strain DSM 17095 / LMG 22695 / WT001) TaxID=1036672 RepID=I3UEV8_ADVKW|nr:sulfur carrier protein ThiS [Advenella kashmirensis]AFK63546.1 ThiS protein [Advenella kashmirensis WT001]
MSTIHISVNGTEHQIASGTTLAQLITQVQKTTGQADDPAAIATAVNEIFIPRPKRGDTVLSDGDQVFTFSPITGG